MKLTSVDFTKNGGKPVDFLVLNDTLEVNAHLHNDSAAGVTGTVPNKGFTYDQTDSFKGHFPPITGSYRVLVGTTPRVNSDDLEWPYRFGWDGTVAPNADVLLVGKIHISVPCGALWFVQLALEFNQWVGPKISKAIPFGIPLLPVSGNADPRLDVLVKELNALHL